MRKIMAYHVINIANNDYVITVKIQATPFIFFDFDASNSFHKIRIYFEFAGIHD